MKESILVDDDSSFLLRQVADHLIYLYGSTCANDTALVMTFAHELQHFVQYNSNRDLWAANTVLLNMKKDFYSTAHVKVFDIPAELEARIVAKKVTRQLCGEQVVCAYISGRIAENVTPEDAEDWRFVQDVEMTTPFDLLTVTRKCFQRLLPYRAQIEETLDLARDGSDFKQLDLSYLFD